MKITADELTLLIEKSNASHVVGISFGPSFVSLNDVPSNDWAKHRIEEVRAQKE